MEGHCPVHLRAVQSRTSDKGSQDSHRQEVQVFSTHPYHLLLDQKIQRNTDFSKTEKGIRRTSRQRNLDSKIRSSSGLSFQVPQLEDAFSR